ncbi:MAG: hypothetical protein LQ343_007011 [Gyalolechia ehrenbergii]|nr:MAG: hypothetical protein LQ343_007011 [Gyalolechia ehrenbergii]
MSQCCLSGFAWNGTPRGKEEKLGHLDAYITGSAESGVAILFLHDIFGWRFPNNRLLADHFAKEVNATVYIPDFFHGEVVEEDTIVDEKKRAQFDFMAWAGRHSKEIRGPEVFEAARALKQDLGFQKIAAIGYCWGGWPAFQLAAKGRDLVDCISVAHPTFVTKEEIDAVGVPVQIIAPENDPAFTPELRAYANKVIPELNVEYDYQHFPKLDHGFAVRGDPNDKTQKEGLERAKNAAVSWFCTILQLR